MKRVVEMSRKDTEFFEQLGAQIIRNRKACGLTQTQLAEILGCSQQHLFAYEKGRYRVPANLLPVLCDVFEISLDELLGVETSGRKSGRRSKIEKQLERLSDLPKSKQKFISEMIETVLQQNAA